MYDIYMIFNICLVVIYIIGISTGGFYCIKNIYVNNCKNNDTISTPRFKYTIYKEENPINDVCCICLSDIYKKIENKKILQLECSHVFHEECIKEWVKKMHERNLIYTCPLCLNILV